MLGPAAIEFGCLRIGDNEFFLAFGVGQTLPESHREFGPIVGRKLQELRERAGFQGVILSCGGAVHQLDRST